MEVYVYFQELQVPVELNPTDHCQYRSDSKEAGRSAGAESPSDLRSITG